MSKTTEANLKLAGFMWYNDSRPIEKGQLRIVRNIKDEAPELQQDEFSDEVNKVMDMGAKKSQKTDKFAGQKKKGR